jgi:hypothetical protein
LSHWDATRTTDVHGEQLLAEATSTLTQHLCQTVASERDTSQQPINHHLHCFLLPYCPCPAAVRTASLLSDLDTCRSGAVHMNIQLQVCHISCCPVIVRQLMAGGSLGVQEAWRSLGSLAQGFTNQVEGYDAHLHTPQDPGCNRHLRHVSLHMHACYCFLLQALHLQATVSSQQGKGCNINPSAQQRMGHHGS